MSDSESARIWNGIREFLHRLSRRLAYGTDPLVIFSQADEGDVQRQRSYCEQRFAAETDEFIRELIRTKELPKHARNVVRFYAGQRIEWASNFLRVLLTASAAGVLIFQEPVKRWIRRSTRRSVTSVSGRSMPEWCATSS